MKTINLHKNQVVISRLLKPWYLCLLALVFPFSSFGQDLTYHGSSTTIHKVVSEQQHAYELMITLPPGFDKNKSYETLYYLDGWWLSEIVKGSYTLLQIMDLSRDIVLVGISVDGDELAWNTQRTRDFTPSGYDVDQMKIKMKSGVGKNGIDMNPSTSGEADAFIDFLEKKVFTYVEALHPNLVKQRGFIGHSFGGLFGIYISQQRPDLFTNLIVLSPALWWNKNEILKPELFEKLKNQKAPTNLFIAYGGKESKLIAKPSIEVDQLIKDLNKEKLNYKFKCYEEANHNSILPRAIYDGILFLYGKK